MASEMEKMGGVPASQGDKEWLDQKLEDVPRREQGDLVVAHITQALDDADIFYKEHRSHVTPRVVEAFKLPPSWLSAG